MDKGQLVTIGIAALAGAIAKEFVAWLFATVRSLSIVVTFKSKLVAFFNKTNLSIIWHVLGLLFYSALLVNFARDPSPPTRLSVLLAIGSIIAILFLMISLLFKLAELQAKRAKNRT